MPLDVEALLPAGEPREWELRTKEKPHPLLVVALCMYLAILVAYPVVDGLRGQFSFGSLGHWNWFLQMAFYLPATCGLFMPTVEYITLLIGLMTVHAAVWFAAVMTTIRFLVSPESIWQDAGESVTGLGGVLFRLIVVNFVPLLVAELYIFARHAYIRRAIARMQRIENLVLFVFVASCQIVMAPCLWIGIHALVANVWLTFASSLPVLAWLAIAVAVALVVNSCLWVYATQGRLRNPPPVTDNTDVLSGGLITPYDTGVVPIGRVGASPDNSEVVVSSFLPPMALPLSTDGILPPREQNVTHESAFSRVETGTQYAVPVLHPQTELEMDTALGVYSGIPTESTPLLKAAYDLPDTRSGA